MPPTQGYSQIARITSGELMYLSGQVGLDASGQLAGADYASQLDQIFRNIKSGLESVGAGLENLVKLNFYVSSALQTGDIMADHLAIRDKYINLANPPASAFVFVSRLARPEWLLEVESIAVKP